MHYNVSFIAKEQLKQSVTQVAQATEAISV